MDTENKPKRKILKYILLVLLIIFAIFIALVIRRMVIFSSLRDKISKYEGSTNYYVKVSSNSGILTECYVKEPSYLVKVVNTNSEGVRNVTNHFDGTQINTYIETDEAKVALLDSHGLPSAVMIVDGIGIGDSKWNLFLMSMLSSITSKEMNGKDCYYIRGMGWETYIDKETGLMVRAYSGTEVKETGEETKMYNDYEYKFDIVTDEDLKAPDIKDYEVHENNE